MISATADTDMPTMTMRRWVSSCALAMAILSGVPGKYLTMKPVGFLYAESARVELVKYSCSFPGTLLVQMPIIRSN